MVFIGLVTIVFDKEKGRLRAQYNSHWVQFPKHLRTREGVKYVCELKEYSSVNNVISYRSLGDIKEAA